MSSQTGRARFGLSSGWIAPQAVAYNDGTTLARYNVTAPSATPTPYLIGYDFGFNIPPTANIDGVVTSFQRQLVVQSASSSGSQLPYLPTGAAALSPQYSYTSTVTPVVFTVSVQLFTGMFIGTSFNPTNQWGADLALDIAGGDTFSWNAGLTPNLVNMPGFGFGVAVRADVDPVILYAQNFSMTVFYS